MTEFIGGHLFKGSFYVDSAQHVISGAICVFHYVNIVVATCQLKLTFDVTLCQAMLHEVKWKFQYLIIQFVR